MPITGLMKRECSILSLSLLGKSIKAFLIILILSVAQFTLLVFSLARGISLKTDRLDSGLSPSYTERLFELITNILLFPLNFIQEVLPLASIGGYWGYVLLGLNSLLWGLVLYHVYAFIRFRNS
jgi:hypothetical protein